MTKKRNKKTTQLKQKQKQSQVVNVYTAPKRRNPLSQSSAPIIRPVYHQVPIFNPIPVHRFETNQQPVGTKSESDVLISGLRAEIKMIQKGNEIDEEIRNQREFMSTLKPLGMQSSKSTEVHHFKPEADSDHTTRINTNLNKHFGYEAHTTSSSLKKS